LGTSNFCKNIEELFIALNFNQHLYDIFNHFSNYFNQPKNIANYFSNYFNQLNDIFQRSQQIKFLSKIIINHVIVIIINIIINILIKLLINPQYKQGFPKLIRLSNFNTLSILTIQQK
jgi:hypothetical protein